MSKVALPTRMEPAPYQAQRYINVPDGKPIPLVGGPKDPIEKQVQERAVVHVKQFDLSRPDDVAEVEAVWQLPCDNAGTVLEHRVDFDPASGRYLTMIRWATYEFILPQQPA